MNMQNIVNQLLASNNPFSMIMGMLPNQNLKTNFSNLTNSNSDIEKKKKIADLCNQYGINKSQLEQALRSQRR